jgi:mannosyltransferase
MKTFLAKLQALRFTPVIDVAAVLLAIGAFTAAVMPSLLSSSTYFDEGYSAYLAKFDVFTGAGYTALDVHPPLYYAVLHVWQSVVGGSIADLRMLSVMFGWVAIVMCYLLVRRWFGRQTAFLALLLLVISPLFIRYGTAIRMYTMALAIAFTATYVLLRALNSKDKRWWIGYSVLVAAGMWTNYFMALVWTTHLIWLLYEYRGQEHVMQGWRRAFKWAVILYLPWLPWLLIRYGEVQADGFWIKPISFDTLASSLTQSIVFRSAAETTSWLAIGVIVLLVGITYAGKSAYKELGEQRRSAFRLVLAMSTLPAVLLILGSLPPLRSSFVYRYVLVAAVSGAVLCAVIIMNAKFRRHDMLLRSLLGILTVLLTAYGTVHAIDIGNRNLDTGVQTKWGQVMADIYHTNRKATIVLRSPYDYFATSLYKQPGYEVKFLQSKSLANVGSTKPLYDHPEDGVVDFNGIDKVWIVGGTSSDVEAPREGKWTRKEYFMERDDMKNAVVAAAAYYERVK